MLAVDRAEIAVLVGPFVPDGDTVLVEIFDVGVAAQEPEQFVDDRFQVQLLGGEQRKALGKIEAHLMAEDREGADAGAVALLHAVASTRSMRSRYWRIVLGRWRFRPSCGNEFNVK